MKNKWLDLNRQKKVKPEKIDDVEFIIDESGWVIVTPSFPDLSKINVPQPSIPSIVPIDDGD